MTSKLLISKPYRRAIPVLLAVSLPILACWLWSSLTLAASEEQLERVRAVKGISALVRHGQPREMPSISFANANGETKTLADFRGKVLLLNVWATWCAPCKIEMPALDRLQARLGSDAFTVLSVSTDRSGIREPAAFFAKAGIAHLTLYNDDTAETNVKLKAEGLPLTLIVDASGREIARLLGPADWDSPAADAAISSFITKP